MAWEKDFMSNDELSELLADEYPGTTLVQNRTPKNGEVIIRLPNGTLIKATSQKNLRAKLKEFKENGSIVNGKEIGSLGIEI